MNDPNTSVRLRNACDACHKLKRRCTGAMPCENCVLYASTCFYSLAGPLGRPRGSRSRRNISNGDNNNMKTMSRPAPKHGLPRRRRESYQEQPPSPSAASSSRSGPSGFNHTMDVAQGGAELGFTGHNNNDDEATSGTFDSDILADLDLHFDDFNSTSAFKLSVNTTQSPDAELSLFSTSEADALHDHDYSPTTLTLDASSSLSHATSADNTNDNTPLLISPTMQMNFEQQPQPQHHHEYPIRQQQFYQHQHQQTQPPRSVALPSPVTGSGSSTPTNCQCIPGLSSLLNDFKRGTGDDKGPPPSLDDVLSRVSDALAQWSALAACPRCQNSDGEDSDDGETLLIAALSMRRVVAQLRAVGCRPGFKGFGDDPPPELHLGAFQVTGPDRTMMLGVLRTITVRKLDAAVATMRQMLRARQMRRGARGSGSDTGVVLHHIESILDELANTIKHLH